MWKKKQFWLTWVHFGGNVVWCHLCFLRVGLLPEISQVWPIQEHAGQGYCPPGDKEKVKTHARHHFYSLLLYQFLHISVLSPPPSQRVPLHETPAALQPLPCSGCHPGGGRTGQGGRASRYQLCRRLQCLTPGPKKKNNVTAQSPPLSLLITIVTTQGALLCFFIFLSTRTVCVYLATARILTLQRPLGASLLIPKAQAVNSRGGKRKMSF